MSVADRSLRRAPLVALSALDAFVHRTILRDPRGLSLWPSLVPIGGGIVARGSFLLHQIFGVSRQDGMLFVEATGDENPIHRDGDVIPGALTAAKAVAALEVLFPRLTVSGARFKFRGIGRYEQTFRNQLSWSFLRDGEVVVGVRTLEGARLIVEGEVSGRILAEAPRVDVRARRGNRAEIERVEGFFEALGILPRAYLERRGRPFLAYPRAFLLSLPSGEMVRRFEGKGGILSVLDLEFPAPAPVPVTGGRLPEVELDWKRVGRSFSKILTRIRDGIEEHCRGFALVLVPGALPT